MIGFYLTTTGEYSPEQVADISNSIILDDRNKTFKAMNQYVFDFQKLSADYKTLTSDSSREGLSIYGAKAMYDDLYAKIPEGAYFQRIESSINTLEEWQTVVNTSVDTIDSSINSLETWHDAVNTSIADINSSISSIKTDYIPNASMGANGGVATLDASGRVPSSQLPSYVDDIIEGYLHESVFYEDAEYQHAITGEGGKIYVDLTTNTSWRWGGSAYTQVSKSLALGETDGTAYEGSKGKALKDAFDLHEASTSIHITDEERAAWNNASDNSHTHDNKIVLDGITAGDITNFIDASNAKHTHSNADILNGLTDTSISNWDDAATKAHEHTNKALLDGIADSSFHTHANKSILDGISADDVTNWNDASNAKHTHSNSAILNGITDASISAWDEGEANVNADWNATEGDASILNRPTLGDAAEKDVADVIESSTGALVTDGAIKAYVDDTISKAHEHTNKDILDGIADSSFHSHSNKNILDAIIDASVDAWNNAAADAHTHDNISVLDEITSTDVTNWNDASNKKHEHNNKAILDGIADSSFHEHDNKSVLDEITSTDVTNWIDASNAKHTHINGAILNSITDSSFHVHDNMSVLNSITSTDVANWIDASNNKHNHTNKGILDSIVDSSFHTHDNKSVLDGITSTDVANWIDASNNQHTHSNSDILNGFTDASIAEFIKDTSYSQGSVQDLITGTDTTPMVWDASVINAYVGQLDANAVRYKGDINAGTGEIVGTNPTETLTSVANKKGDVYVVSTEGTLCGVDMQVGDSIIFKKNVAKGTPPVATDLTFVQGTVKVTNEDATLQWGQLTKIANVEGVDISVGLPANPTAGYGNVVTKNYTDTIDASTGALVTDGAVKNYLDDTISKAHIHTNKTVLDGITATDVTNWNDASNNKHSHSNSGILDGLTDTSISNWNTAFTNNHTHDNKSVLDGITSTDVANWVDASNAKHTHSNAGILDGLTDTSISNWNTAFTNNHTHDNKTVLDGITSTDVTNWNDASNNKHSHSNSGILDGLTDTSISNWNDAYSWGNHANGGYAQQSYAADVSSKLATVNTTLTTRVQNVSTYAINVSTYAANVSTYAVDVSNNLAADYQNALNTAAMFMLANFAGLPTTLNSPEYKYVLTDASSAVLLGKRQDDSWFFGDNTDDLMDAIIDTYAPDDTLFSSMYRLAVAISLVKPSAVNTNINNVEWKWVLVDSQDHILMGVKQDNTWYLGATINEVLDCAVETYASTSAAKQGTYANRPTTPNIGQMYFATDKTATGGSNQGVPIWWNGTNWVDAIGNTVS